MLVEIKHVRQIPNEPKRRWFTSVEQDLVLWYDASKKIIGWQFCYDKTHVEQALSWQCDGGFSHLTVDDGEHAGALSYKSTPMLRSSEVFDKAYVLDLFLSNTKNLPREVLHLIHEQIEQYGKQS